MKTLLILLFFACSSSVAAQCSDNTISPTDTLEYCMAYYNGSDKKVYFASAKEYFWLDNYLYRTESPSGLFRFIDDMSKQGWRVLSSNLVKKEDGYYIYDYYYFSLYRKKVKK